MHRCFPQSSTSTGRIRSPRRTSSTKTRPKALNISSLELYPYSVVAYIHRSLSTYLTMAVVVPKPNRQLPINCTSVNKLIICHCQQPFSVAVNNIVCYCQQTVQLPPIPKPIQLKQTISTKTTIMRPKNVWKEIINHVFCVVFCVLCDVYHNTVLCQQSNANFFNKI